MSQDDAEVTTGTAVATSNNGKMEPLRAMPEGGVALAKDQIIGAQDIQYEYLAVPEWAPDEASRDKTYVMIKTLSARERDAFEASMVVGVGKAQRIDTNNVRAKLASLIIVDPVTRERMFTRDDIAKLGAKSAAALDRVYERGMQLSKISKADLEEAEGNSAAGQLDV